MDPMWSFLLVDGPGEVMIRYLAPDEPCYYLLYMLYFCVELFVQRSLCLIFLLNMGPGKGDTIV